MKIKRSSQISDSDNSDGASNSNQLSKNRKAEDGSSDSSDAEEETLKPPTASPKKQVASNPLEKFLQDNSSLTQLSLSEVVSKHDDICLLEIPKAIDPQLLLGKLINFDQNTKVKLNKTKYVVEPFLEDLKPINLYSKHLKIVHPIASLKLRERTKHKTAHGDVKTEAFTPNLPENLKVRHPLFGADFQDKIVLDENIQQKLDHSIEHALNKLKRKKKKDRSKDKDSDVESVKSIKTKKSRSKNDVADSSETTGSRKQRNRDEDNKEEAIFALLESHISDNRKDRAKTSAHESEWEQKPKMEKKKKKKGNDIANSTAISSFQLPNFDFDVSCIVDQEISGQKLRKDKAKNELGNMILNGYANESEAEIKHKKKKQSFSEVETSDIGTKGKKEKKIKEEIMENLNDAEVSQGQWKKKKSFESGNADESSLYNTDYEAEVDVKHAQKKNKSLEKKMKQELVESEVEVTTGHKKKKNKSFEKSDPNEFNQNGSNYESAVQTKLGKKTLKQSMCELEESEVEAAQSLGSKKKKDKSPGKKVKHELLDTTETFAVPQIQIKSESPVKRKNKDSSKERVTDDRDEIDSLISRQNIKQEPYDSSTSESHSKKRKKNRNVGDESSDSSPKKKSKRSEITEDTNPLIMDILNKVKSELETSRKHKKKGKLDK